jgi:hypothetical protein
MSYSNSDLLTNGSYARHGRIYRTCAQQSGTTYLRLEAALRVYRLRVGLVRLGLGAYLRARGISGAARMVQLMRSSPGEKAPHISQQRTFREKLEPVCARTQRAATLHSSSGMAASASAGAFMTYWA